MGWSFTYGSTKKSIVEEIIREMTYETENVRSAVLAKSLVGNHLWYVVEQEVKATGGRDRIICLSLLQYDRQDKCFGHKDMTESCGPCYHDCPLSFLAMSPVPDSEFAKGWRDGVRAHHAKKAATKRATPVTVGKTYQLLHASPTVGSTVRIVAVQQTGRTGKGRVYRGVVEHGATYRIPARMIGAEIPVEA